MQLDPVVTSSCALVVAVIFANALVHKLRHPGWFRQQLADYGLLPASLVKPVARLLPWLEALIALALLIPVSRSAAAISAALLLALYAAAIGINLWRGRRDIDCGCSGPGQAQPLRPQLLGRNALLITLAVLAACPPLLRDFALFDLFIVIASAATGLLLYAAADALMANTPRLMKLIGR